MCNIDDEKLRVSELQTKWSLSIRQGRRFDKPNMYWDKQFFSKGSDEAALHVTNLQQMKASSWWYMPQNPLS